MASQPQSVSGVAPLNYAGVVVPQRPAFNARRSWTWKGDHLFRVYVTPGRLWFVRIGGSRQTNAAVGAQFGLIGALVTYFVNKHNRSKEAQRVRENEDKGIDELMASHKRNHMLETSQISNAAIEPGGFFSGQLCRLTFNHAGEKKRVTCRFETADDVTAAISTLTPMLPGLRVGVEYNEKKKRYRKIKPS